VAATVSNVAWMTTAFEDLVGDLDYPMYVVTASADGEPSGCLVGFATQASIDPPRLLVFLSKRNHTFRVAQRTSTLVVNFLHAGNHDLAALFGEETGDHSAKFASCEWSPGPDGAPILHGVRGWIAGRVIARLDAGDHVGHLLETVDAQRTARPNDGLLMFRSVRDMSPGHEA
jgi:flavin reductase (DIM6/NTAB) family NADH-FMN oxidoreductase RutF